MSGRELSTSLPTVQGPTECSWWGQSLKWILSNLQAPDEIITNPLRRANYLSWFSRFLSHTSQSFLLPQSCVQSVQGHVLLPGVRYSTSVFCWKKHTWLIFLRWPLPPLKANPSLSSVLRLPWAPSCLPAYCRLRESSFLILLWWGRVLGPWNAPFPRRPSHLKVWTGHRQGFVCQNQINVFRNAVGDMLSGDPVLLLCVCWKNSEKDRIL